MWLVFVPGTSHRGSEEIWGTGNNLSHLMVADLLFVVFGIPHRSALGPTFFPFIFLALMVSYLL